MSQIGYSLRKASEELGMDRHTLSRWIGRGWVKAVVLPSGRFRISEEELSHWRGKLSGQDSSQSVEG